MKTALVTGASSGIGRATARMLAGNGWRVLVVARRAERLEELQRETGDDCHPVVVDLCAGDASSIITEAINHHAAGRLDALINNAGVFALAPVEDQDSTHIDQLLSVNVRSVMLTTRACLPALTRAQGSIINVSSVAANIAFPGCGVYSATKAALDAWSRTLREELRSVGVRVGVVAPGATATEAFPGAYMPDVDLSRLCRAEQIAEVITTLCELPSNISMDYVAVTPSVGPV